MEDSRANLDHALQAYEKNSLGVAIKFANQHIRQFRNDPSGWELLSDINFRRHWFIEAEECIGRAIKLDSQSAEYHLKRSRCLTMIGDKQQALKTINCAVTLKPTSASVLDGIGAIYSLCDEQEKALLFFQEAIALEPDNPHYLYNLAAAQRMNGKLEEAEITCDRTLELNPNDYKAHYTRADLRKQTTENNHIEEMETLLARGIANWRGELLLRYALAKECEDVEKYQDSFQHLEIGANLQRQHMQYNVDDDVLVIDKIIDKHTRENFKSFRSCHSSPEPIFILGLPRTGTTLVERILSSHSQVYAAGELSNFPQEVIAATRKLSQGKLGKLEMVDKILELDFESLGRAYIDGTRPRTGHSKHFIDKLPLNYLYCGLIHASLPNAKIIHLNRQPMDTCYAIYKTMFTGTYPFSYDLSDLGSYYLAYRRLMTHWREELGDAMLDVHYEHLIDDQEAVSREIINFCNLDWESQCLEYHKNQSASSTASASQVRQSVYRSSIDKWKYYSRELKPLLDIFEENGLGN